MRNLLNGVGVGLLGLTLTLVALHRDVSAQDDPRKPTVATERANENLNWGLLGLIGVLGLGGLFRADRHDAARRDANVTSSSRNART